MCRYRFGVKLDGIQAALQVPAAEMEKLEGQLHALELSSPPLRRVQLYRLPTGDWRVLLGFDDSASFTVQRIKVALLARGLGAEFTDLDHFEGASRQEYGHQTQALPLFGQGAVAQAFTEMRNHGAAPVLRVSFDSVDSLLAAWARHVGEGALWVPSPRAIEGERFRVVFATPGDDYPGNAGKRLHRPAPGPGHGVWLEVQPADELQRLLTTVQQQRREAPRRAPPQPVQHFDSDLQVRIETIPELAAKWASDLSHGGLFVETARPPELRSRLRLLLTLPNDEVLALPAEVVHRVLNGPRIGVGLQFLDRTEGAFSAIDALLAEPVRKPRVLVVDDEAIWRSTLVRVLKSLDADVVLAKDGREGLVKLIDGYFDLDLVILDLHMPELDGRSLIDRVRRLGGDQALKIFLFSATSREELAQLGEPGLATAVFSKLDSLEVLAAQIARELGRKWPPRELSVAA